jgi:lysyl-tRNA synthetase class 2
MKDLFEEKVGISDIGGRTLPELHEAAKRLSIHTTADDTWSDVFYRIYVSRIEAELSTDEAMILYEYPIWQAALAAPTPDGLYAERFELFSGRLELCNAFTELTDAVAQRARFEREREERAQAGKSVFPIDEELLSLLPSLPSKTFGNGLGVDRLLMALLRKTSIDDVVLIPHSALF